MLLSIVTISKRPGGLDVSRESLGRQTIWRDLVAKGDVEWIFVDELQRDARRQEAFRRACNELGLTSDTGIHLYPPDYSPVRFGKLCRASNTGLAHARGQYLLPYNDFLWLPDDAIERMLETTSYALPLLVTTLNHRTRTPPKDACVDLETQDTSYSIYREEFDPARWGFPDTVELYGADAPRDQPDYPAFHTNPIDWEAPFALGPVAVLRAIGGWDEELDYGYAHDNILLAARFLQSDASARIHLLRSVRVISIDHQTYFADPPTMDAALRRNQAVVLPKLGPAPAPVVTTRHTRPSVTNRPSIAWYLPDSGNWGNLDPQNPFAKAMGGRETAAIRLAQELAKLGWEAEILAPTGVEQQVGQGVIWTDANKSAIRRLSDHDVVVGMDHRMSFRRIRAKLNIVHFQCTYPSDHYGPIPDLDAFVDGYVLLSNYQRFTLRSVDPTISADKCVIFGNGIDLARYDALDVPMVPGRLVWSSSPDRGLFHLLRWWPTLKARYPHLTLRCFYNLKALDPWRWTMQLQAEWLRTIEEGAHLDGVEYIGPVDQPALAREQKQAELFVYPCDPSAATESWCITALENAAARVPMLLSNADCLPEVYGGQRNAAWFGRVPVRDEEWCSAVAGLLDDPRAARNTVDNARRLAESYTWQKLAARWDAWLRERLTLDPRRDGDAILDLAEAASQPPALLTAV